MFRRGCRALTITLSSRYVSVVEVLNWFGIQWVLPRTIKEVMYNWVFGRRRTRPKAWDVVSLAING